MARSAPSTMKLGVTLWNPCGIACAFFAMYTSCDTWKGTAPIFEVLVDPATSRRLTCERFPVTIPPGSFEMTDAFMQAALEEARQGLVEGGIPIGSVLVSGTRILGRGHNRR